MLFYFLILFTLLFTTVSIAEEAPNGTLIISYQTGPKEERLDRIRFRLKNGNQKGQLYPKKSALVSGDNNCQHRMVVIENLPAGKYTLEFIVPNADHFFEKILPRTIQLHSQEIVKINQFIRPRQTELKDPSSLDFTGLPREIASKTTHQHLSLPN